MNESEFRISPAAKLVRGVAGSNPVFTLGKPIRYAEGG